MVGRLSGLTALLITAAVFFVGYGIPAILSHELTSEISQLVDSEGSDTQAPSDSPSRDRDIVQPLHIKASALQMGTIGSTAMVEWTVPISNLSNSELFCEMQSSCNCARMTPENFLLAAGKTQQVQLLLRLPQVKSDGPQPFRIRLSAAYSGAIEGAATWELSGEVLSQIILVPAEVDFSGVLYTKGQSATKIVQIGARIACRDLRLHFDESLLTAEVSRGKERNCWSLAVTPRVALCDSACDVVTTIKIAPIKEDGSLLSELALPVRICVLHDVSADPGRVFFGVQPTDTELTKAIVLKSASGRPFSIDSTQVDDQGDCTRSQVPQRTSRR